MDLSVLIAARNEEFLARTVEDVLIKRRAKTEVIVVLDGSWANPPLPDHPDVKIIYHSESIGQRAAINEAANLSTAKYILKLDAHCIVDEGFDVKLMADCEYNWTVIPTMYNLHGFDWVCVGSPGFNKPGTNEPQNGCGHRLYQCPTPKECEKCHGKMEREIIWKPRLHKRTWFMRFDSTLHFQYFGARDKHPDAQDDIADTMSFIGACWFMHRKRWLEIEGLDENYGSWGQVGSEISCKTWLSGGRLVVNKKTWFSHLFRTQGGDFGFPYKQSGKQVEHARKLCKDIWYHNKWSKQIRPLSWLVDKFYPLDNDKKEGPDWHTPNGKQTLDMVNQEGEKFYKERGITPEPKQVSKGCVYYTDNALNMRIAKACRNQIASIGLPIVSTSLKPLNFGKNFCMAPLKRGYEAYFRQILKALEESTSDVIFFTEHDWLYHPSHFKFTPLRDNTFYYNWNWWRVRSNDGLAVHYDTQLLPGIVAYRKLLVEYYRQVVSYLEKEGFTSDNAHKVGFEPGTHGRAEFSRKYNVERFDSEFPNIDIRHEGSLTSSKWSVSEFRNPKNAQNWVEKDASEIEGWNFKKGDFLGSI